MAENKKSFILYCDQKGVWDKLNNEQAGKLIKHIIAYVNDENPTTDDFITELAFEPIKQQLKRDLKSWEKQYNQRVEAGKRSAEVRKRNSTTVDDRSVSSTVNVNGNVNVTDNVNENVNDIFIIVENEKVFDVRSILEYYEAQLNGMQTENHNIAWKPMVESWFTQHIGEEFKDAMHVKNSFKKHYLYQKPSNGKAPRPKAFELNDFLEKK